MSHAINPYQPPEQHAAASDQDASVPVTLANGPRHRRLATNQYLLRWHPRRLFLGSLLMIGVSTVCIHSSVQWGPIPFLLTAASVMIVTALIYMALVRATKQKIDAKREDYGLSVDQPYTLRTEPDSMELELASGLTHRWEYDEIKLHRTSQGLLVSPEPMLFFLIPRGHDANLTETRRFVSAIQSRTSAAAA